MVGGRFVWGRLFATLRAREQSLVGRLAYAALSPLIPAVLLARVARKANRPVKNRVKSPADRTS